jgi:hypothetical protein
MDVVDGNLMGGYHIVFTGDFLQHQPIAAKPLYSFADVDPMKIIKMYGSKKEAEGRMLWMMVDTVVLLKEQHRFSEATPGGKELYNMVRRMWDYSKPFDTKDAFDLLDKLQRRVVKNEGMDAFLARIPRAIVLRNEVKPTLNITLAFNHACHIGQRVVFWRSMDRDFTTFREFSKQVVDLLNRQESNKTNNMPTFMVFFPGCRYIFPENSFPDICWANNFSCTGVKLLLDPKEAADDLSMPFRTLRYPPVAICVRPDGTSIGKLIQNVPEHCVPVVRTRKKFQVCISTEY